MNNIQVSNIFINNKGHKVEVTNYHETVKQCRMALTYLISTNQIWESILEWKHDLMAILELYKTDFTLDDFVHFRHKLTRIEFNRFSNTFFDNKVPLDKNVKNVYHYFDQHIILESNDNHFYIESEEGLVAISKSSLPEVEEWLYLEIF